jgi:hypothetical protein
LGLYVRDEPKRRILLQEGVAPLLLFALLPSGEHRPTSLLGQKHGTAIPGLNVACPYLATVDERKDEPQVDARLWFAIRKALVSKFSSAIF